MNDLRATITAAALTFANALVDAIERCTSHLDRSVSAGKAPRPRGPRHAPGSDYAPDEVTKARAARALRQLGYIDAGTKKKPDGGESHE
jgi:hypothetical protein